MPAPRVVVRCDSGTAFDARLELDGKVLDIPILSMKWEIKDANSMAVLTVEIENVEINADVLRVVIDGEPAVEAAP